LISQCEELQQDLYEEVMKSLDENGTIVYQSLKKMPLLLAVFEETMRLYPPVVGLPRECTKPEVMRGKLIKPKDEIIISLWLQHRHYDKWDNPMEFDPFRFYNKKAGDRCPAYMPFGKGDRVCIGSAFAKQESLLILSHIIKRFRLKNLTEGVIPLSKITLKPNKPINIKFMSRS
jgi:cytochrome P450